MTFGGAAFWGKCNHYWSLIRPVVVAALTTTGSLTDHYWFSVEPVVVRPLPYIGCFSALVFVYVTPLRRTPSEEVRIILQEG